LSAARTTDEAVLKSRSRRPTADLSSGRTNQKARTYHALLDAAMSFIREGRDFSIADVADAARVGRTTAYGYFPTKDMLFAQAVSEIALRADFRDLTELFQQSSDIRTRIEAIVEASDASIRAHEAEYRAMLRLSLEADQEGEPRRVVYRPKRLLAALAPARESLDKPALDRLVAALSLCVGIEAHIALRDVCGLSPEEAAEIKLWAAEALLKAALADARD
jgi:AcrR family transcriptional regulator